jgi:hypothetical protein
MTMRKGVCDDFPPFCPRRSRMGWSGELRSRNVRLEPDPRQDRLSRFISRNPLSLYGRR